MLFNSYIFIFVFLPLAVLLFQALERAGYREAALAFLVLASLVFYGWWNPIYLGLIAASILFNYSVGYLLSSGKQAGISARALLILGIASNLGLLAYFKYTGFFAANLNAVAGTSWQPASIVLPLAISFFTFQQIAFLVDAYRGNTREYRFLHYCLFVTFFPQLIAGPIVHHKEMLPQFEHGGREDTLLSRLGVGLSIFVIGLFKKTIIADGVGLYADAVFDAAAGGTHLTFFEAWGGTLAYTFQLYFDFSAYSDMAVGLALLFGIRLPLNFFSPYKATSIIEFWRLWNMTLSRFLRDHLYIPLGGSRNGQVRRYVNVMLTMLLGGLWHGAGWTFVVWGGLHGIYLVLNHAWHRLLRSLRQGRDGALGFPGIARLVTFLSVAMAWVFFRADSLTTAWSILRAMTGADGISLPRGLGDRLVPALKAELLDAGFTFDGAFYNQLASWQPMALVYFAALFVIVWWLPNTAQLFRGQAPVLDLGKYDGMLRGRGLLRNLEWRPTTLWAVAIGVLFMVALLGISRATEFIYYQF